MTDQVPIKEIGERLTALEVSLSNYSKDLEQQDDRFREVIMEIRSTLKSLTADRRADSIMMNELRIDFHKLMAAHDSAKHSTNVLLKELADLRQEINDNTAQRKLLTMGAAFLVGVGSIIVTALTIIRHFRGVV